MNIKAKQNAKINWKKILVVGVILIVAGYQWYTKQQTNNPGNNQNQVVNNGDSGRYDAKLPDGIGKSNGNSANSNTNNLPIAKLPDAKNGTVTDGKSLTRDDYLIAKGRNRFESPAGLVYTMGGGGEHRVDHVMNHATDDPNRPSHGVFDGDEVTILKLLDEAYEMVKDNSKYVKSENSRGNTAYTISMGRQVGYEGGQKGKRNGHRALKGVRLVLDGDRVITAYPYR